MALMEQLNAVTKKHYIPVLVDNIFKGNIITYKMLRNSKPVSGGYNIVIPIEYDKVDDDSGSPAADTAGFYAGADSLAYGPKDFISSAQYNWVQAYATIRMTGLEEHTNEGPEKVIDLMESKLKNAERSLKDVFATNVYSANVDTSSAQKSFQGLQMVCSSSTSATSTDSDGSTAVSTTLGGISPDSDTAAWVGGGITALTDTDASPADTAVEYEDLVDTSDSNYIQTLLRQKYGALTIGGDTPTIIVCSQVVFDSYEESLTAQKRFGASSATLADAGFQNLLYRGTPVVVDQALEANAGDYMFFLNERGMGFKHHRKRNFVWEDFIKPVDKDFMVGRIFWMGALCVSHRRVQGAYRGLPTTYASE